MKFFNAGVLNPTNRHILALSSLALVVIVLATASPEAHALSGGVFSGGGGTGIAIPNNGKSISAVSQNITNSLRSAGVLVTALAYLGALVFGFMGALKWKAYGEQPDRTPLKVPVTYMAIAAILAALPDFLGTGVATIWGSGATVVTQP